MAAITWRQLVSPDDSGAFKALHAAGDTINNGFEAVNRAITSRQLAGQTQEDIGRKTNVANYLDAVQQASTPEAAAALQNSPEMKTLGASVDPRDRELVRNAIEARLTSTRQNVTAGQTFQDTQTAWDSRDSVNAAFSNAIASKDPAQIQAFVDSIPANHPARADLMTKVAGLVQGNAKFASDLDTAKATQAATATNAAANTKNAETNAVQAQTQQKQAETQAKELGIRTQEALEKRLTSLTETISGKAQGLSAPAAQKEISDFIKSLPEGDQLHMQEAISNLSNDKRYSGMFTAGDVISLARGTVDDGWGFRKAIWNNTGDSIKSAADKMLADPSFIKRQQERADSIKRLELQQGVLAQSLYPSNPKPSVPGNTPVAVTPGTPQSANPDAKGNPIPPSAEQAMMDKRVALEQVKIALGEQKDFSPEIRKYMVEQNRQAAENGGRAMAAGGVKLGAAFNDLVTLPVRGVAGAINSVLNVPNSLGANLPTIPDNGWLSSMTPYSDRLSAQSSKEDLIKQRNELERSIKDASKKAK